MCVHDHTKKKEKEGRRYTPESRMAAVILGFKKVEEKEGNPVKKKE